MIETIEFGKNYHWIILHTDFLTNDTTDYQTLGLDEETITYALDRYERAHTEYQTDTNTFTIIYNVLKRTKEENHYETILPLVKSDERRFSQAGGRISQCLAAERRG